MVIATTRSKKGIIFLNFWLHQFSNDPKHPVSCHFIFPVTVSYFPLVLKKTELFTGYKNNTSKSNSGDSFLYCVVNLFNYPNKLNSTRTTNQTCLKAT